MVTRFFLLLFFIQDLGAQIAISSYEKCWAVLHPIAALKVRHISRLCYHYYRPDSLAPILDQYINGGKADAFRHMFFMAAFAQKVKPKKLEKLGKAHEKANYRQFRKQQYEEGEAADSLGSVMDLNNNSAGIEAGRNNRHVPLNELAGIIISEIHSGKALIMKRNPKGKYLDCEGNELQPDQYKGKWSVPKCLVSSDFIYSD